jgi:hypothetical protein
MAITKNPSQKYAFLLSGSVSDRYVNDLKMVYETLYRFYNYPKDHIWVVFGDGATDKTFFSGANTAHIADYDSAFDTFSTPAAVHADHTLLLYFTGNGTSAPTLTFDSGGSIDTTWLEDKLMNMASGQMHVVMQQSYCGGFNAVIPLTGSGVYSYTFACTSGQTSTGNTTGSFFTKAWTAGLQFKTLLSGADIGKYADELAPVSEAFHISLRQAWLFAKGLLGDLNSGDTSTFLFDEVGAPFFLGRPDFLIRDGDYETLIDPSYESPDIFLTHPNHPSITDPDYYVQDTGGAIDNIINVRVLNIGTHPLRKFYVGITRYTSGAGGEGEDRVNDVNLTSEVLCPIVKPTDASQPSDALPALFSYLAKFDDIAFPDTTHRCVRAKVQLAAFTSTDLDTWVWNYAALNEEAQRNIDFSGLTDSKAGEGTPPPAGEGQAPDTPDEIPEDENDTEAEENNQNHLKAFKEHIYEIKNQYKKKKKFLIVFPRNYRKYSNKIIFEWYGFDTPETKKLKPIRVIEQPNLHIEFTLQPGESKKILLYFAMKPGAKLKETLILPFDILTEIDKREYKLKHLRRTLIRGFKTEYALIGGISLKIMQSAATLSGKITDKNGKPVHNAMVVIQTANRRQGAIIRTHKDGSYTFPKINPDAYSVMVLTDHRHTKAEPIVFYPGNKKSLVQKMDFNEKKFIPGVPVKIIIDKLVFKNREDIKRHSDTAYTAIVIADKKENKKHIVALSGKGKTGTMVKSRKNEITIGKSIFDGSVSESFTIEMYAKERGDKSSGNGHQIFSKQIGGNSLKWYGCHTESGEKEDIQVKYRVQRL